MYTILEVKKLAADIYQMEVEAARVAAACEPGQFVMVRTDGEGERIPLTICDYDREKGTIVVVFQVAGAGTFQMAGQRAGDSFHDVAGPLGCPSEFVREAPEALRRKRFLFVAGGVGTAPVYPQVKWLKEHGVCADVVVGSKTKELLILEEEMKAVAGNLYVATDDGSYGRHGMVTKVIEELAAEGKRYDVCVAIGPMIMMKFVCLLTRKLSIPTVVSLNPIMVDGTGMCGACRVTVDGEVKFACVDGPEFDGHRVNFEEAMRRQQLYKTREGQDFLKAKEGESHHGNCGACR
jgi:ferredoxin--NADP+ reductase